MKRLITYIFLIFSINTAAGGQDVTVTSSFDTSRIFLGDQIKFTIIIDKPSALNLSLPIFKDTISKNIEIVSGPVIDSSLLHGRTKIIEKYLVTSFDSGYYQVPPVYAELKNSSGLKRFYSDYSLLEVIRVKIAPADTTAKIYDIIKPYKAPLTVGEVLPWILGALIITAFIWFAVRYIRSHKKSKPDYEPVPNPDPAHVIAFRELEELKEEKLWQKGEVKKYYTRLTEIIRQYLQNRYSVFSLELTTSETLEALLNTGFKKDQLYVRLKTILTGADLVKFAKHKPEPSENESHFQNSWDFVVNTKEDAQLPTPAIENDKDKEAGV